MIFITGDVHCRIPGSWEQNLCGSELKASKTYLEILKKNGLTSTLFINGKCFEDNKEEVNKILKFNVELGGHSYNNFENLGAFKSYFNRLVFGCIYGSSSRQTKDIARTKKAFEDFGLEMVSWRTHAFGSNSKTFGILSNIGVKYVSDLLGETRPYSKDGIIHIPINIPVDQNTIAYGKLTPENRNPFASCVKGRIRPSEWLEIVKRRVSDNEKRGINSILLVHPATMACLDNFETFRSLAKFLAKYKSSKISEFKLR